MEPTSTLFNWPRECNCPVTDYAVLPAGLFCLRHGKMAVTFSISLGGHAIEFVTKGVRYTLTLEGEPGEQLPVLNSYPCEGKYWELRVNWQCKKARRAAYHWRRSTVAYPAEEFSEANYNEDGRSQTDIVWLMPDESWRTKG